MKYNEKYDLYLDDDLVIYYWDKKKDKLMQRKIYKSTNGYLLVSTKIGLKRVHRVIYETFIGPIPDGFEIDHINTVRDDNRLENLRCVTCKENNNNALSLKHKSEAMKGKTNKKGKTTSEFGEKFKEYYGITRYNNPKLYNKEYWYYRYNHKCRWEV